MMHVKIRFTLVLSVSMLLGTAGVSAGKPLGVQLLRPDSLAGWDHGTPSPRGWTVADGLLSGTEKSTPLLSGWTFGDFQLQFRWSVADDGACKLLLPQVPAGKGVELVLREGDGCGRLSDGDAELSPGGKAKSRKGKMHTAAVRREGKKLSFTVDGRWLYEVEIAADRRFGLGLAVTSGQPRWPTSGWRNRPANPCSMERISPAGGRREISRNGR